MKKSQRKKKRRRRMRRKKSDILNYSKIIVEERGPKNVDMKITKKGAAEGQIMMRGPINYLQF